jgi:hypothetical protein
VRVSPSRRLGRAAGDEACWTASPVRAAASPDPRPSPGRRPGIERGDGARGAAAPGDALLQEPHSHPGCRGSCVHGNRGSVLSTCVAAHSWQRAATRPGETTARPPAVGTCSAGISYLSHEFHRLQRVRAHTEPVLARVTHASQAGKVKVPVRNNTIINMCWIPGWADCGSGYSAFRRFAKIAGHGVCMDAFGTVCSGGRPGYRACGRMTDRRRYFLDR